MRRVRSRDDDATFSFVDILRILERMYQCSLAFFVHKIFFLIESKSFCCRNVSSKSRRDEDVATQIEETLLQRHKQHESIVKDFFCSRFTLDSRRSCAR